MQGGVISHRSAPLENPANGSLAYIFRFTKKPDRLRTVRFLDMLIGLSFV